MWLSDPILLFFHFALVILLCWMGWQDWKTREVSNALSIPLAAFGLIGLLLRLRSNDPTAQVALIVILVVTAVALRGWMGGADWKALVGLWGLWTLGGIAALVGGGVWGAIVMMRTRNRQVSFPGISAYALAVTLTFLGEVAIFLFNTV